MGRVKCKLKWVKKYLKRTGRMTTLLELNKDLEGRLKKDERNSSQSKPKIQKEDRKFREDRLHTKKEQRKKELNESNKEYKQKEERKPVKLSFAIQKAPERKKIEVDQPKPKKKDRSKDVEESKTVDVPKEFKKLAKKFGLPEDHLEFFYEHRESFNWEIKKKFAVHCAEPGCKETVKQTRGCLNEHMISVHDYKDIPCGKTDCAFIAYSQKNLNLHNSHFHGIGRKPANHAPYGCPFSSCKKVFGRTSELRNHVNTHKYIVYSCEYCPYRAVKYAKLLLHLKMHFNIRDFVCEICSHSTTNIGSLNMHKKATHNTDGFYCDYCGFFSKTFSEFNRHRRTCSERLKHSRIL